MTSTGNLKIICFQKGTCLPNLHFFLDSKSSCQGCNTCSPVDGQNPANQLLRQFILLFTGFYTSKVLVWKFLSLTLRLKHLYSEEHPTETCWMKLLPFEPGESLVFTSAMDHTWKVLGGIGDTSCSLAISPIYVNSRQIYTPQGFVYISLPEQFTVFTSVSPYFPYKFTG